MIDKAHVKEKLAQALYPVTVLTSNCETSKRYQKMTSKLRKKLLEVNKEGGVSKEAVQPMIF